MRITGGDARGRKIRIKRFLLSEELRPTSQKVRKAIFDILQDKIIDADFLDLFAGTGAVGTEALSRGARRAVFVEIKKVLINNINKNSQLFEIKDKIFLYQEDAIRFLKRADEVFDIIFADPPYGFEWYSDLISLVSERGLLRTGGTLIIEHSSRIDLPLNDKLKAKKVYRYGDTTLSFLSQNSADGNIAAAILAY